MPLNCRSALRRSNAAPAVAAAAAGSACSAKTPMSSAIFLHVAPGTPRGSWAELRRKAWSNDIARPQPGNMPLVGTMGRLTACAILMCRGPAYMARQSVRIARGKCSSTACAASSLRSTDANAFWQSRK